MKVLLLAVVKLVIVIFLYSSGIVSNQSAQSFRGVPHTNFSCQYLTEEGHQESIFVEMILVDWLKGLYKLCGRHEKVEGGYDKTVIEPVLHANCNTKVRLITQEGRLKPVFNRQGYRGR